MDDILKELKELIEDGVDLNLILDQERRVDDIIRILPDDVSAALTVISVAIDKYAAKQHLKSSEVWQTMTEVSAQVHKEFGDYGE